MGAMGGNMMGNKYEGAELDDSFRKAVESAGDMLDGVDDSDRMLRQLDAA